MHDVYEDIEEMLCGELENISKKNELTSSALDVMYKAVDIIKDIKTIQMYDEQYSGDYPQYSGDDDYARSGARGRRGYVRRDSYGRYRDDIHSDMKEQLESMLSRAQTDKEREMVRKWIGQLG